MIKRLIFDIDGTLIRGVNFKEAITNTMKEFGIYSDQNLEKFLDAINTYENNYDNYNKKDYLYYFENQLGIRLKENFLDSYFHNLRYVIPKEFQDIKETILYLSKKHELVLLSNYFEESQRNRLEEMGINQYFKEYYGQNKIKPYKEAYMSASGNYLPSECIIIGDNIELDINIPAQLGFNTILISDNFKSDSINIIREISDLKEIL